MTYVPQNDWEARIARAARRLIEGDMANLAEGRSSRTVLVANRVNDDELETLFFTASQEAGVGAISLRWGRDRNAGPRRANLAFTHEGCRLEVRDCVFWSDDDGPILLVPFDARQDFHVAVGPDGLEQRSGRPAAMLGQGMSRANTRLEACARKLRLGDVGQVFKVVTTAEAA